MVTPSMDIVDLIERGGLFWLKFRRAVVPAAHHAAPDAKFVMSDAASFAAQSKFRPATVVDDDDPFICTLLGQRCTGVVGLRPDKLKYSINFHNFFVSY